MEYIPRDREELNWREETALIELVMHGLAKVRPHLLFRGFSSHSLNAEGLYVATSSAIHALNEQDWRMADKYGSETENPLYYAHLAAAKYQAHPVLGIYDGRAFTQTAPSYYETVDGAAVSTHCLRVVIWEP
jgi:hypothetical protein